MLCAVPLPFVPVVDAFVVMVWVWAPLELAVPTVPLTSPDPEYGIAGYESSFAKVVLMHFF